MKIFVMSDVESKYIWEHFPKEKFRDVDVVISCGDLHPEYLTYVETMTNVPLLYVHGNHDEKYSRIPPEGCECIEDRIVRIGGVRFLGLGGSMKYRSGEHQYTEQQMRRRIRRLWWKLLWNRGFDVLVTHAPMAGFHDGTDLCHQGFRSLRRLIDRYHPKYFLHGHIHMNYGMQSPREDKYGSTTVINCYRTHFIELPDIPAGKAGYPKS